MTQIELVEIKTEYDYIETILEDVIRVEEHFLVVDIDGEAPDDILDQLQAIAKENGIKSDCNFRLLTISKKPRFPPRYTYQLVF